MGIADGTKGLARQTGQNKAHPYTPGGTQPTPVTSASGSSGGGGGGAPSGPASGDLGGTYPNPTVTSVQGHAVSSAVPTAGEVLEWTFRSPAWTPTLNDPLNPLNFGGFGDGSSHQITSLDISTYGAGWLGSYAVGTEWDTLAIQEAIYAAYGGPSALHGTTNQNLNRAVYIPAGLWLINLPINITRTIGANIQGAGCFSTTLRNQLAQICININGMSYSYLAHMQIQQNASVPNSSNPLVEYNWDGTTTGWSAGSQSNIFEDLYLSGEGQGSPQMNAGYGIRVAIGGGGSQCSENLFIGCRYIWCEYGWQSASANALANNHIGGNYANCRLDGIHYLAGSGNVYGTAFQNSINAAWNTTGQVAYGGYDIHYQNSSNDSAVVVGCRSESPQFIKVEAQATVKVQNCNIVPFIAAWQASHVYAAGAIVTGPGDGAAYTCDTGGTSAASQPAGSGGAQWDSSHTTVNSITDNTAKWHVLNHVIAQGGTSYDDCIFQWGVTTPQNGNAVSVTRYKNCHVSRVDWITPGTLTGGGNEGYLGFSAEGIILDLGGGPNTGTPNTPYTFQPYGTETHHSHYLYGPDTFIGWYLNLTAPVGFSRGDANSGTNLIAVYGTLGKRAPLGTDLYTYQTNTAGADQTIAAGQSTGNAAGGTIHLQTAAAGASGATLNALADSITITSATTTIPTGQLLLGSAAGGTQLDITPLADATPGIRVTAHSGTQSADFLQTWNFGFKNFSVTPAGRVGAYSYFTTVRAGVPAQVATVDLTAQAAAIGATTLFNNNQGGLLRVSWAAIITRAATASSVLGGAGGFQITYTDNDTGAVTTPLAVPNAAATGNTTTTQLSGVIVVNYKASTNVQYSFGYTSVGATTMQYALHVTLELLG